MDFAATLFEFRYRWWVIFFIFFLAFSAYFFDHVNSIQAIANHGGKYFGISVTYNTYRLFLAFGTLLLVIAAFLRTWGTSYLQAEVMRDSQVRTEKLLADGPYRYVRNPLYLGNIFTAVGIGLMASPTGFFILSFGMTLFVVRLILREESELSRDQGEQYRRYCAAVPRLLPALRPRIPAAGNSHNWAQGFRTESMYWLLALAMAAFAITLNIKVFWGVCTFAIASSWVFHRVRQQKANKDPASS